MPFEVAFTAAYSLLLTAGAIGLHRLGRVDPSAWSSRILAGYRAQHPDPLPASPPDAFPHRDAGRLHSVIGAVACLAAILISVTQLLRHHRPGEVLLLAGSAVVAGVALRPLLRAAQRPQHKGYRDEALGMSESTPALDVKHDGRGPHGTGGSPVTDWEL